MSLLLKIRRILSYKPHGAAIRFWRGYHQAWPMPGCRKSHRISANMDWLNWARAYRYMSLTPSRTLHMTRHPSGSRVHSHPVVGEFENRRQARNWDFPGLTHVNFFCPPPWQVLHGRQPWHAIWHQHRQKFKMTLECCVGNCKYLHPNGNHLLLIWYTLWT